MKVDPRGPREYRECEVCGHDITQYSRRARTCSTKCARQLKPRLARVRAHLCYKGASDRGAWVDPAFTIDRLTQIILERGDCYLCGTSLANDYHIDHIHPIARGGRHEESNIGFLCPVCNVHKADRTVGEYLVYLRDYDSPRIQRILTLYAEGAANISRAIEMGLSRRKT